MMNGNYPRRPEVIDADKIFDYLNPLCLDAYEHQLPSRLNLSFLKSHFDELYDYDAPTNLYDEKKVKLLRDQAEKFGFQGDLSALEELKGVTGQAERGSYVYLDPFDNTIRTTEIMSGSYDELRLDFSEYFKAGNIPLLQVHTHPISRLFSPQDYMSLCINVSGMRLSKASLVLCPDVQVLAIATATTPKLTAEQASDFTAQWDGDFHRQNASIQEEEQNYRDFLAQTGMSRPMIHTLRSKEYTAKVENLANNFHIRLARSLNTKMYVSTNRQDFHEAT